MPLPDVFDGWSRPRSEQGVSVNPERFSRGRDHITVLDAEWVAPDDAHRLLNALGFVFCAEDSSDAVLYYMCAGRADRLRIPVRVPRRCASVREIARILHAFQTGV